MDLLDAFGIPTIGVDDYEADDVIATLSTSERGPTFIVTGDRDLFQLVDDKRRVKVVYLARGIANHDLVDEAWISQKYQIPGDRYALFAMIRGDASDGLPGIKGIGEKGAATIANSFTNMSEVIEAAKKDHPELPAPLRKKILADLDYAKIAPTLVHCHREVPMPDFSKDVPKAPADIQHILDFKNNYNLGASVDRMISALGW